MRCVVCRQGEVSRGEATVTLERGECVVVFRGVPADVCRDCGEYYLADEVASDLLARADAAVRAGALVTVQRYAA